MNFTKMHGAGNDFILVETDDVLRNWPKLSIAMCDRHFGIGGDGLILVMPSDKADARMREFNPDGSEAEACGNGIRCLARFVFEKGLVGPRAEQISVETPAGIRKLKLLKKGNKLMSIQAAMGKPTFNAREIPVLLEQSSQKIVYIKSMLSYPVAVDGIALLLNFVSMSNPHAVFFQQSPVADFPLTQLGPKVEHLSIFPRRTNFEVARIINQKQIEVRVWERGVGETLGCGSGACAVTVAAQLLGYVDHKVEVILPGGILEVEWDRVEEVLLSGPAEIVFTGEWPD
jgi:diaminopimelate epimerase